MNDGPLLAIDPFKLLHHLFHDPRHKRNVGYTLKLLYLFFFSLPHVVIEQLCHTRRGVWQYPFVLCFSASVLLLVLSLLFRTPGGDLLFMVWGVFTFQWIAESIWAWRRIKRDRREHPMDEGFSFPALIGLKGQILPLIVVGITGFFLIGTELGRIIGLLMVTGSIGGVIYTLKLKAGVTEDYLEHRARTAGALQAEGDDRAFREVRED